MTTSMAERTLFAQSHIIDHVEYLGGIENFVVSPDMRLAVVNARNKYRLFLSEQKKEKEKACMKRKTERGAGIR